MDSVRTLSETKLFSHAHMIWACFLGGPIGGALLMAKNYKSMGDEEKEISSLMIGLGAALVMLFVGWNIRFVAMLLPIVNLLAMEKWYRTEQFGMFVSHIKNGGAVYTWKAVLILCLISLMVGGGLLLLFTMMIKAWSG